uniref:Transposase n=1 Tax=Salmonella enterica subsp. salamae TaxID=59202 RepID=I3W432_SALER|nr:transposase [Salmonella enterica subsp. salamae]
MMKNAAKTIGKRLYGILNAMRYGVSNGNAEALNRKIRLLRIKARGYRNRERCKLGVMFHYGKLYAIEAEIRGSPADERLAVRKERTVPQMQSLYDWVNSAGFSSPVGSIFHE